MPVRENNSLKNHFKIALEMEYLFLSGKENCFNNIIIFKKREKSIQTDFIGETFAIPIKLLLL